MKKHHYRIIETLYYDILIDASNTTDTEIKTAVMSEFLKRKEQGLTADGSELDFHKVGDENEEN